MSSFMHRSRAIACLSNPAHPGDVVTPTRNKKFGGHPTAERVAEIKTSVVAATMKRFSKKGAAFSMEEVAELTDVSRQVIYRGWPSKIDLVIEAIEGMLSDELGRATEKHDDPVMAMKELAWRHFGSDPTASNRLSIYLQVESFGNDHRHERLVE